MNSKELFNIVKSGKKPEIRFTEDPELYLEESVDPEMMGRVIKASVDEDCLVFRIDLNPYQEHNQSVGKPNWYNQEGEAVLTYLESNFYPKDGVEVLYLPLDAEVPIELIEPNSLVGEYLQGDKEDSYVKWLENQILEYRKKEGNK